MKKRILKSIFTLLLLMLNGTSSSLFSQEIAGTIPAGTSVLYDVVDMSIVQDNHDTTAYLDLDDDGNPDIRVWFLRGYPPADGPNYVIFYELNNVFSFCTTIGDPMRTSLFEAGDTLCADGHEWTTDSMNIVGCFGGWNCTGSSDPVNNKYVAYRKNETWEIGWIKVSMSLYSGVEPDTITFQIDEMIVLDLGTGTDFVSEQLEFDLVPNPALDGNFTVHCSEQFSAIEIYNTHGQLIKTYQVDEAQMNLPEAKGLYIVKIRNENGLAGSRRIVRL